MKGKRTAVQYDLDGTVRDNSHRQHLAPPDIAAATEQDWQQWALACGDDVPLLGTIARMKLDNQQHQVHLCSAASAVSLDQTTTWMNSYAPGAWDYLRMRAMGDNRPGWEIKVENILEVQESGIDVVLAYEDLKWDAEKIYAHTRVPVVLINPAYDWVEIIKGRG